MLRSFDYELVRRLRDKRYTCAAIALVKGALPLAFAALSMTASMAYADYGKGLRAWESEQYQDALAEWLSAAEADDGRAMLAIGRAYLQGLGVLQDYVEAYKWFNLAASRGVREALEERDTMGAGMAPSDRAKARKFARQWRPGGGMLPTYALHRAAGSGDTTGIEAALRAWVDVDQRDDRGWTALMHAVDKGNVLIVESLIEAGADVNIRAPDGATALFMSAARSQPEIVGLLMNAGADIFVRGPRGITAVEVAKKTFGEADAVRERGLIPEVIRLVMGLAMHVPFVGETFRDCEACPEMVVVPARDFMMGSNEEQDEGPVHRVTITRPFAVGKYEVTFREWEACVTEGGCLHRPGDEGWGRGDRPAINISWNDAQEYAKWLSHRTGHEYRLLSESEWEYAARAGTDNPYHFGLDISPDQGNYLGSRHDRTVPVGSYQPDESELHEERSYPPNDFGLHDVHGNVWEWTGDCWHDDYEHAPADGSAWTLGGNCERRILRGGSWYDRPWHLRSAYRNWTEAGFRDNGYGFRIARTLSP